MAKIPGYFSAIFGHSPFGELQQHVALCVNATEELLLLFDAKFAGDWAAVEASYERLTALEHQADGIKRRIRTQLPRGFFLPVARTDLLDMLGKQDEIANTSRDVAGTILGRRLEFPPSMKASVQQLVKTSVDTCRQTQQIVDHLDELIDTAFKGPQASRVVSMIEKVEALEHQTDELVVGIRNQIFDLEAELPPVHVMFLYKTLDLISELADTAERVAHRVQLMLAK